jgi:ABC-type transporter Mla MlaB component
MQRKAALHVVLGGPLERREARQAIERLGDPSRLESVCINCSGATSVDGAFLRLLASFRRKFINAGVEPEKIVLVLPEGDVALREFENSDLLRPFTTMKVRHDRHPMWHQS